MRKTFFITGIGTDVGKTVVSAVFCKALNADYWKPIQAGDLNHSDTHKVQQWSQLEEHKFHPNSYALNSAMSPDAAADIDNVEIQIERIARPETIEPLVIEGAGGLLVPINNDKVIADLIEPHDHVIVVCRHYLGSINHTLLTLDYLHKNSIRYSLVFNGERNLASEASILARASAQSVMFVENSHDISSEFIAKTALRLKPQIEQL